MKSSYLHTNFRQSSLSAAEARHSLLLAMAADVQRLREQAKRVEQLRHDKERRDGKKISQETAAHEIGVSVRQYRTWEGKGATPEFENLKAMADYFDTTPDYIEYGTSAPRRGETPELMADLSEESQLDRVERKLDQLLERLPAPATTEVPDEDDALPPAPPIPPDAVEPTIPDESTTPEAPDEPETGEEEVG